MICTTCHREIVVGQRVVTNHVMTATASGQGLFLGLEGYQHADCYDVEGPRYNDDGSVMDERIAIKGEKYDDVVEEPFVQNGNSPEAE